MQPRWKADQPDVYRAGHHSTKEPWSVDGAIREAGVVHGAFVVDSFSRMWHSDWEPDVYMPRMLAAVQEVTGRTCIGLCADWAALTAASSSGMTFGGMVEQLPDNLEFIISVICGNDLFTDGGVAQYNDEWDSAAQLLASEMKRKSRKQLAVVGGSSRVWQYHKASWSSEELELYDNNALRLASAFSSHNVLGITGESELHNLDTVDWIGHVHARSAPKVIAAFVSWTRQCLGLSNQMLMPSWVNRLSQSVREWLPTQSEQHALAVDEAAGSAGYKEGSMREQEEACSRTASNLVSQGSLAERWRCLWTWVWPVGSDAQTSMAAKIDLSSGHADGKSRYCSCGWFAGGV